MQAADTFWHLANFFAPAVVTGGVAAAAVTLGSGRFDPRLLLRLWAWASGAAALVSIGGLAVFSNDGKVATYAAMVLAVAVTLWWAESRIPRH